MIFARRISKRLENRYCSRPFDFRFRYRGYAVVVLGLLVKAVSEWIHAFALILQYVARVPLQKHFFFAGLPGVSLGGRKKKRDEDRNDCSVKTRGAAWRGFGNPARRN